MTKKQRIEYFICTLCVFLSGLLLYGFLGYNATTLPETLFVKIFSSVFVGAVGGFVISSFASGFFLFLRFFKKRGLILKVIACILWPLSLSISFYFGFFSYFPYQIYNLVCIVDASRKEKAARFEALRAQEAHAASQEAKICDTVAEGDTSHTEPTPTEDPAPPKTP